MTSFLCKICSSHLLLVLASVIEKACHPSPCGINTNCHVANNQANCTCLPGFKGNPLTGCTNECKSDNDCSSQHSCRDSKCTNPCSDCGVNAECKGVESHRAECKCLKGYRGDPYRICSVECTTNNECPSHMPACVSNACVNPCKNACGVNAECNLKNHLAVCSCPKRMTGNPLTSCTPIKPIVSLSLPGLSVTI